MDYRRLDLAAELAADEIAELVGSSGSVGRPSH